MKVALTYGFGIAVATSLFTLVLYFAGFHDPEKIASGTTKLLGLISPAIFVVGAVLAIRARRDTAEDGSMSYGAGVGTGVLTGLFTGLFSGAFTLLYGTVIYPGFREAMRTAQREELAKSGMSESQIDQFGWMDMFTSPLFLAASGLFGMVLFGLIIGLIASAFLKRAAPAMPPPISH